MWNIFTDRKRRFLEINWVLVSSVWHRSIIVRRDCPRRCLCGVLIDVLSRPRGKSSSFQVVVGFCMCVCVHVCVMYVRGHTHTHTRSSCWGCQHPLGRDLSLRVTAKHHTWVISICAGGGHLGLLGVAHHPWHLPTIQPIAAKGSVMPCPSYWRDSLEQPRDDAGLKKPPPCPPLPLVFSPSFSQPFVRCNFHMFEQSTIEHHPSRVLPHFSKPGSTSLSPSLSSESILLQMSVSLHQGEQIGTWRCAAVTRYDRTFHFLGCSRTYKEAVVGSVSVCLGSVDAIVMDLCLGDIIRWAGHFERVSWEVHSP